MRTSLHQPALVLLVTALTFAAGCEKSSSDRASPGTPAMPGGDASSSAGDGGAAPPANATVDIGTIDVSWDRGALSASAKFQKRNVSGCEESDVGVCHVSVCPDSLAGSGTSAVLSAGVITIAGGSAPITLDKAPQGDGSYAKTNAVSPSLEPGHALTASSTGGDVPAFAGQMGKVPADIDVDEDPLGQIDYGKDLTVTWSGGDGASKIFVELASASGKIGIVTCQFDPGANMGTVPSSALAKLPACPDPGVCTWAVLPRSRDRFMAGDFAIDFRVSAGGATGTFTN